MSSTVQALRGFQGVKCMTGPEREDFRELRSEMRDGFRDLKEIIKDLGARVTTLERTDAADAAVEAERLKMAEAAAEAAVVKGQSRWRAIGIAVAAIGSLGALAIQVWNAVQ
jgi:hypothetical protein